MINTRSFTPRCHRYALQMKSVFRIVMKNHHMDRKIPKMNKKRKTTIII